ncbi:MAG: HEAT repeat domain-containing protein [Elusimicrobia bacterium]|nr:HEAT repeat domain-containing protein [Elusimicrobiota bacterium]
MKALLLAVVLGGSQDAVAQAANADQLLSELESAVATPLNKNNARLQRDVMKELRTQRRFNLHRLAEEAGKHGKNWRYRCAVMSIMSEDQDAAVTSALVDNLKKGEDINLRVCAAQQLRIHKNPKTLDPLLEALGESDGKLRASAASALGSLRDKRALAKLSKTIADSDRPTAINSIWAVGEIGDEAGVAPLLEAMSTMSETEKFNLIAALGKIGGTRSRQELMRMRASADKLTAELIDATIKKMRPTEP